MRFVKACPFFVSFVFIFGSEVSNRAERSKADLLTLSITDLLSCLLSLFSGDSKVGSLTMFLFDKYSLTSFTLEGNIF